MNCDTHLSVPLIHDPGYLYLLPSHGCVLSDLSDASTISEKQHDFFPLSSSTLCNTLFLYTLFLLSSQYTLRQTMPQSAGRERQKIRKGGEWKKVNLTINNVYLGTSKHLRSLFSVSSTFRKYESIL